MVRDRVSVLQLDRCVMPHTDGNISAQEGCAILTTRGPGPLLAITIRNGCCLLADVLSSLKSTTLQYGLQTVVHATSLGTHLVRASDSSVSSREPGSVFIREGDVQSSQCFANDIGMTDAWMFGDICTLLQSKKDLNCILALVSQYAYQEGRAQSLSLFYIPYERVSGNGAIF